MTSVKPTKSSDTRATTLNAEQPQRNKIEAKVGLFTAGAVILLVYGWSWLKSASILHPPQLITVQFHDIAGIATNAPVNINGVRVGTVEQIELKGKGQVLLHLRIRTEEVQVPQGSTFTIQTLGLVGAKYIEISLPEETPGQAEPPPIDPNTVVIGQDPVRVELVINKIATNLNQMIGRVSDDKSQSSLASALQNSGETIHNINEAANKLNKNMDKISKAAESFQKTSDKVGRVADKAQAMTDNANSFFKEGSTALSSISRMSDNFSTTSKKVNKLLDNPALAADMKEFGHSLRDTANTITKAVTELNSTLKDKPLRRDLIAILQKVNKSTEDIYDSIKALNTMTDDKGLRKDIKSVVRDAKESVDKVHDIMADPSYKNDLKSTIREVRTAAKNVDTTSKQLHQILNKRAPLLQMMFARPGKLDKKKNAGVPAKKP